MVLPEERLGRTGAVEDGDRLVAGTVALGDADRRFLDMLHHLVEAVLIAVDGRVVATNRALRDMLGPPHANAVLGRPLTELLEPCAEPAAYDLRRADGTTSAVHVVGADARWRDVPAVQLVIRDDRRERQDGEPGEDRLRALIQHNADVIFIIQPDGSITYASPSVERMLGWRPDEVSGRDGFDFVDPDDLSEAIDRLAREVSTPEDRTDPLEIRLIHRDGSVRPVEVIGMNRLSNPGIGGIVLNVHDMSARKRHEQLLTHRAHHDPVTGLPNRVLYHDRLQYALDRRARHHKAVGVLFIDLDGFKQVNDDFGHPAGDELLRAVGERLVGEARDGDVVARFGGDEFIVLCEDLASVEELLGVAERMIGAVAAPVPLDAGVARVTASVGAVLAASDGPCDGAALLRMADVAMYRAKQLGKARCQLWIP